MKKTLRFSLLISAIFISPIAAADAEVLNAMMGIASEAKVNCIKTNDVQETLEKAFIKMNRELGMERIATEKVVALQSQLKDHLMELEGHKEAELEELASKLVATNKQLEETLHALEDARATIRLLDGFLKHEQEEAAEESGDEGEGEGHDVEVERFKALIAVDEAIDRLQLGINILVHLPAGIDDARRGVVKQNVTRRMRELYAAQERFREVLNKESGDEGKGEGYNDAKVERFKALIAVDEAIDMLQIEISLFGGLPADIDDARRRAAQQNVTRYVRELYAAQERFREVLNKKSDDESHKSDDEFCESEESGCCRCISL